MTARSSLPTITPETQAVRLRGRQSSRPGTEWEVGTPSQAPYLCIIKMGLGAAESGCPDPTQGPMPHWVGKPGWHAWLQTTDPPKPGPQPPLSLRTARSQAWGLPRKSCKALLPHPLPATPPPGGFPTALWTHVQRGKGSSTALSKDSCPKAPAPR